MVNSVSGFGIIPGPIGISAKAIGPKTITWFYAPRRKDLVNAFESVAVRNLMKAAMPAFTECSADMVLFLKRILGSHSKTILGNYVSKYRSRLYSSKPLSTNVVYKLNDKIEYDMIKFYYKARIRGYAIKGKKNLNYTFADNIPLKPGMLIHETKTVGRSGFEKKHLVMWLGWIKSLGGAYYFDSLVPKLHKYTAGKNFVQTSVSSSKYHFWRIVAIYDPWHGRE